MSTSNGPPGLTKRETAADRAAMLQLGQRLATVLQAGDVVVLTGALGAGKTTLTQGIGAGLGVRGPVTSPTFVIARVHPSQVQGPALVHVDAYRLSSIAEVDDLDLDATLESAVTVVEWGEGLVDDLTCDRLDIMIERPHGHPEAGPDGDRNTLPPAQEGEPRIVTLTFTGERWAALDWPESAAATP